MIALRRLVDRVLDAPERRRPRLRVEHQPRGARVAVARLPDAAGVHEPLALRHVDSSAPSQRLLGRSCRRRCARSSTRRASARSGRRAAAGRRGTRRPARPRARTPRRGRAGWRGRGRRPRVWPSGASAGEELARLVADLLHGPARGGAGAHREVAHVDVAAHDQVVVAGQAHLDHLGDQLRCRRRAARRSRPRRPRHQTWSGSLLPDVGEHGLERRQVAVDVGDDGYAHGSDGGIGTAAPGRARSRELQDQSEPAQGQRGPPRA